MINLVIGDIVGSMFGWVSAVAGWLAELSADVFWGVVTSYPAIAVYGAVVAASYLVAHVPALMQRLIPPAALYAAGAAKLCLVASAAMMFAFGYRVADGRAEIENLKNDLAWAQFNEGQARDLASLADGLKKDAEARAAAAEGQLSDYETKFGRNPADPPPGVLEWMRSLQQHPQRRADTGTDQPQRDAVPHVRGLREKRQ